MEVFETHAALAFAAHKREVIIQNYGYHKSHHQLKDYETPEAFLNFLGFQKTFSKPVRRTLCLRATERAKGRALEAMEKPSKSPPISVVKTLFGRPNP